MCFHFSLTQQMAKIEAALQVNWDGEEWQPVYHADGFTFLKMPVITQEDPHHIQLFNWGLIPSWVKTKVDADKLKPQTLNARSETVFEKPSFRSSIKQQRCLIPADGFFEWMDVSGKKIFCFAGIYSCWTDKETGELMQTFSILTTAANPMMERIHNLKKRMPVIVNPSKYQYWLQQGITTETINSFFQPYPEEVMDFYPISKRITSRTEDSNVPETIEPHPLWGIEGAAT